MPAENRVPELVTALCILYTLSVVFVALRIYVRIYISKNWGLDDYFLVATWVSIFISCRLPLKEDY
jgi:hypothetical protein